MEFSSRLLTNPRGIFSGLCLLVLLTFFVFGHEILQNPFLHDDPSPTTASTPRRKAHESGGGGGGYQPVSRNLTICSEIHKHEGFASECEYLSANPVCSSGGFVNYLKFFYCDCRKIKPLGYAVLVIWILTLFYLLANTAADYFCCCLEKLSNLLSLPPTVAGVTLLPLGNGAPDVFASIAAFVARDSGDVGLNSVLGGAVFIVCVVAGAVSICVADKNVRIDKYCFFRDVGFFALTLMSLLTIIIVGEVSVKGAVAFITIYVAYALFVAVSEVLRKQNWKIKLESVTPLLPVASSNRDTEDESLRASLISCPNPEYEKIPHLMWAPKVAVFSDGDGVEGCDRARGCCNADNDTVIGEKPFRYCTKLCSYLEIPLSLPRRLTIPIVDEERWSKPYAVATAFFAPLLLSLLWDMMQETTKVTVYLVGGFSGSVLGILAMKYTSRARPPERFLLPWVLGGFLMSIIWFYIVANELVSVLVALGVVLGIKPSLLALTILAWGNSMGDLMSNVAVAMSGRDGVQVAVSGCYAGPMFNTLVGLGISLLVGAWARRPGSYAVPDDVSLYSTIGFLMLGLVWTVAVLPRNGMRPSRMLGVGLVVIYVCFLAVRVKIAVGDGSFDGLSRVFHL